MNGREARIIAAAWELVAVLREQDDDRDNSPILHAKKREAERRLRKVLEESE